MLKMLLIGLLVSLVLKGGRGSGGNRDRYNDGYEDGYSDRDSYDSDDCDY